MLMKNLTVIVRLRTDAGTAQENDVVAYFPEFVIVRNDNHGLDAVLQGGNPVHDEISVP